MSENKVATNRKARFDYHILDKYEAGISLLGAEVKSIREGGVSLQDSFVRFDAGQAFVYNMHIKAYAFSRWTAEPTRPRRLLLNRPEIDKLSGRVTKKGYTCIPLSLYFNSRGRIKLEIALCQSKKAHDKRDALLERDARREMDRAMKRRKKSH
ncbi:MAG: SsrA-binding protein SmpB [Candidatus Omnitrophica bacterium]|nr:SsrA-binding protein SmpB [Candidatus Omnitrophota bacterium]